MATPPSPNDKQSSCLDCCAGILLFSGVISIVIYLIVVLNRPVHFPTFEIESLSLSTTNNSTINVNTAVWELGFSVGKLHGNKIEDFSVWARCKPTPEFSGKFVEPLYMEDKDSGVGNVTLATVLTPQQTESKTLDCGVMFMGGYSDGSLTLFTASCNNVKVEAETAGRWILVGESRLCPITHHD